MSKIFNPANGKTIDLSKFNTVSYEEAQKYKKIIDAVMGRTCWLINNCKPVFDSRGNYLGYTFFGEFREV